MGTKIKDIGLGTSVYYTYGEAARLLHVSTRQVSSWAKGYVYPSRGTLKSIEPILQTNVSSRGVLNFLELIELFFVREFRKAGVKLSVIREASVMLAREWNNPYPFACEKLKTDGRELLVEDIGSYLTVPKYQQAFDFVENFFKDIDVEDCNALRWWPMGKTERVVIDPNRSFGIPIDSDSGIRTDVLYATYRAEQDIDFVACWYKVSTEAVRAAVRFEEEWLRAA